MSERLSEFRCSSRHDGTYNLIRFPFYFYTFFKIYDEFDVWWTVIEMLGFCCPTDVIRFFHKMLWIIIEGCTVQSQWPHCKLDSWFCVASCSHDYDAVIWNGSLVTEQPTIAWNAHDRHHICNCHLHLLQKSNYLWKLFHFSTSQTVQQGSLYLSV